MVKTLLRKFKRPSYAIWAFILLVTVSIPVLKTGIAHAYDLLTARSVTISNSSVGSLTAGQNVEYAMRFTTAAPSNPTIGSAVLEFCSNSPIIGESCTAPTGMDTNFATLTISTQAGITDFSVDTTNSTANKIILARPSAAAVTTGTQVVVELGNGTSNGLKNPTTLGTYYARMYTYSSTTGTGTNHDAGGAALSTTTSVTITSKVQERLTFCVYTGVSCASPGTNAVLLGNANDVLESAGPYVDKNTKYDIATNASQGVTVRVKGDTLKTGSFSINAIGATATASAAGTEQFGFCNYRDTATATGLTPQAPYDSANCSSTSQTAGLGTPGGASTATFGFDTNSTDGTLSTYGDVMATKTAGASSTGIIAFIGNIADTTEAGIYTTVINFIATGIY